MTNESAPHQTGDPRRLPSFPVNVVPVSGVESRHLRRLIERFAAGSVEPLIVGRDAQTPEAAVIPFTAFVRLLRHDHATEHDDQAELARRVAESDSARAADGGDGLLIDSDEDLFRFAESLGTAGEDWAREQRAQQAQGPEDDG